MSRRATNRGAAVVIAFPGDTRPHPKPTKVRVNRAKRTGEAESILHARFRRQDAQRRAEVDARRAEGAWKLAGVERTPEMLLVLAVLGALTPEQRASVLGSVKAVRLGIGETPATIAAEHLAERLADPCGAVQ